MAWEIYRTGKLTDAQIYRLCAELAEELNTHTVIDVAGAKLSLDAAEHLKDSRESLIGRADSRDTDGRFTVHFRRGTGGSPDGIDGPRRQANAFYDEIGLYTRREPNSSTLSADETLELVQLIARHIQTVPSPAADELAAQGMDVLQGQFARLNGLLTDLTERAQKRREDLEDEYVRLRHDLDEQASKADAVLAERTKNANDSIDKRRDDLDERARLLDDRNHLHVRRELHNKIVDGITRRLTTALVPQEAAVANRTILGISLSGAILLGFYALFSLYEFTEVIRSSSVTVHSVNDDVLRNAKDAKDLSLAMISSGAVWYLLVRATLAGFGSVLLIFYALAWMKQNYADRLRTQRELERYSIDISRASWAVETIMEAKQSGAVIPDLVMAAVTKNLFVGSDRTDLTEGSEHPLSALLRTTSKAKFGPAGAEFELSGRGASKLADKLDD